MPPEEQAIESKLLSNQADLVTINVVRIDRVPDEDDSCRKVLGVKRRIASVV
jgi:hypothetical protein